MPEFPITVLFHEDGDKWVLDNEDQLVCNLEWFDSSDPEESATVTDNKGRTVHLLIVQFEIKAFELK